MKGFKERILVMSFFKRFKHSKPQRVYSSEPVDFEDAIEETSFGKFNIFIMIFIWMVSLAFIFDTTVMSYVMPSAECDLNVSLLNKGLMNAIVHVGMICSALFTGYLADTLGRKRILFGGLLFDSMFNVVTIFSHSFHLTLICKFFSGFFMAGVTTVQLTMMAELHSAKYRSPVTMYVGVTFSIGMLTAPFLAWLILTNPYNISIGFYEIHSWQVYLAACTMPSILALLCIYIVPESPKFLASRNKTDEALEILKRIYVINTGKAADSFPIRSIKPITDQSKNVENRSSVIDDLNNKENQNNNIKSLSHRESTNKFVGFMRSGLNQMKPLVSSEHRMKLLLFFAIQFVGVLAQNSIRLWLPQLFKMMSEHSDNGTFCEMISLGNTTIVDTPKPLNGECEPIVVAPETYENSMIVAGTQVAFGAITSLTINYIGRKRLLIGAMLVSGICTLMLHWSINTLQVIIFASMSVALSTSAVNCVISSNVDLFPTTLRAMALSLTLMIGRVGSITGNLIFPKLLSLGCLPPFLTIACGLFGGALLSILIPQPSKQST